MPGEDGSSFGQHGSRQQIRFLRPLRQKLVEELIPLLVVGTTGSEEVPEWGGSAGEAVIFGICRPQATHLEKGGKNLQITFLFS